MPQTQDQIVTCSVPCAPSLRVVSTFLKIFAAPAPIIRRNEPVALIEELTEWELEVVVGVARGLTNQGIVTCLGISVETVKTHVISAKNKIDAHDRLQMAVMVLLFGLIDPLEA